MNELIDFVQPRTEMPSNLDQAFVAAYEYDAPNIDWFRLFITTNTKPAITTKDWADAYKWQRRDKRVTKTESSYFMPSKERTHMEDSEAKVYATQKLEKHTDFDDFIEYIQSIHVVKINRDQWELSTCNCNKCDHTIDVSSRLSKF